MRDRIKKTRLKNKSQVFNAPRSVNPSRNRKKRESADGTNETYNSKINITENMTIEATDEDGVRVEQIPTIIAEKKGLKKNKRNLSKLDRLP